MTLRRGAELAAALRQHRSARIEVIATRVELLASFRDRDRPQRHLQCAARSVHARPPTPHRPRRLGLRGVAATVQGTIALFQDALGTGKTMAAQVIANALGYELWRVDLSRVVSNWIGEIENLAAVFDAAEEGESVFLFDANLETSYLLQRLDSVTGITILTTNSAPRSIRRSSAVSRSKFSSSYRRARAAVARGPASHPPDRW
jgi:hypothetical protein